MPHVKCLCSTCCFIYSVFHNCKHANKWVFFAHLLLLLVVLFAFLCALVEGWEVYSCSSLCSYACVVEARVIYGGMHVRMRIARGQSNSRCSLCSLPICFSITLVSFSLCILLWNLSPSCTWRETPWTPSLFCYFIIPSALHWSGFLPL